MSKATCRVLTVTLALLLGGGALAKPQTRTYTVQPGDSIWSIAEAFYGSGDKYKIIYEHNKFIGSPPYILKPGQVLTLPVGALSPEAQVEWTRREVKAKPPRSLDWLSASNKMNLWKLYQVSTGEESAVHIVFEDASKLSLADNALLVIYGGSSKTAKAKEKQKTQVLLKEGTVRGGLAALDGGGGAPAAGTPAPMVVETPSGLVELMSTMAQVQADAAASIVSVYEGEAEVKAQGAAVKVQKGYGTVVAKGKKPDPPEPLPPPPGWTLAGEGTAVAVVPTGGRASFEAAWSKVERAKTYRVQLAEDEGFTRVLVDVKVGAEVTRFSLDQIPAGRYFARIAARDAKGLEGLPSAALRIDVVGLGSSRRMARDEATGAWEVVGLTRLDLGGAGADLQWALDEGEFVAGAEPLRVQSAGPHTVKVRRAGEERVTPFAFRVLAVRGTLALSDAAPLPAASEETREVLLTVRDERGRAAPVPGLELLAEPGGAIPLEPLADGRLRALVPAPPAPGPERIGLVARWADGVLARADLEVARKLPAEPYVYRWRRALTTAPWEGRTAATPLPELVAMTRLGVGTALHTTADEDVAAVTLAGELALVEGRLGLDAAVTLFRPPLWWDTTEVNEVGDAVIGLRYELLDDARWSLAPSLRARVPLTTRAGTRLMGVEPGALVAWRAGPELWLESRQAVLFATDLDGARDELSWAADYAALWRPLEALSLSAQLATAIVLDQGLAGASSDAALGLGLGAYLHLDRARLGLAFGLGVGEAGRARFGDVSVGLSLDFGLGTP